MRYLVVTLAVTVVLIGAAIVAAPSLISLRLAEEEIAERIGRMTGGSVRLGGESRFALFPSPRLLLHDVAVLEPEGSGRQPVLRVEEVEAALALLPLLAGQAKVEKLTLFGPRLQVAAADLEGTADPLHAQAIARLFGAVAEHRLTEIVLRDGAVVRGDGAARQTHPIVFARLQVNREGAAPSAALDAWVPWCGSVVALSAELDDPEAAFSGNGRPLRIVASAEPMLDSEAAKADLAGSPATVVADGTVSLARRLAQSLGMPAAWNKLLGQLEIAGSLAVDQSALTLSDATFGLGGHVAEGNLRVGLQRNHPVLRKLLASGEDERCSYAKAFTAKSVAELRELTVSSRLLSLADIEFEASAERLGLAGLGLADVSLSFVSGEGQMTLGIDGENENGGAISLGLAVEQGFGAAGDGVSIQMAGLLEAVSVTDLGQFVWAQWGHPLIGVTKPPRGEGRLEFAFASHGKSVGDHFDSLDGYAAGRIRDGSLDGADIVATLEQLIDGDKVMIEGEAPFLPVGGRTHFQTLDAHLDVGAGTARMEHVRIAGDRFEISLSGAGDLTRGNVQADGSASLYQAAADSPNGDQRKLVELPFGIGGTFRELMVAPGVPKQHHGAGSGWNFEPLDRSRLVHRGED